MCASFPFRFEGGIWDLNAYIELVKKHHEMAESEPKAYPKHQRDKFLIFAYHFTLRLKQVQSISRCPVCVGPPSSPVRYLSEQKSFETDGTRLRAL